MRVLHFRLLPLLKDEAYFPEVGLPMGFRVPSQGYSQEQQKLRLVCVCLRPLNHFVVFTISSHCNKNTPALWASGHEEFIHAENSNTSSLGSRSLGGNKDGEGESAHESGISWRDNYCLCARGSSCLDTSGLPLTEPYLHHDVLTAEGR